ncbi:hypothetical protein DND36_00835 [Pseudomonas savastanoi pv. glycinea]|nr:hypothetical protein DND36_00835 [Pseudomonas savastanoi pv. glycinea]
MGDALRHRSVPRCHSQGREPLVLCLRM